MIIREAAEGDEKALRTLFCDYYEELDCGEDPLHLFDEYLLPDLKAKLLKVAVAEVDGKICGFAVYQTDDVLNDWNFMEGYGDLREIFVIPTERKKGAGKELAAYAEKDLKKEGAQKIYTLPTAEAESFFIKCGFCDSGKFCEETESKVFIKE